MLRVFVGAKSSIKIKGVLKMFFHDDEKEGKEEALERLKDLMMGEMGDRMGRFKKPIAASMTIEKVPKEALPEGSGKAYYYRLTTTPAELSAS